jgi:Flp pilus assembly pilin Flp
VSRQRKERGIRDDSGQAMVEYALIVSMMMAALVGVTFEFLPEFVMALQEYYDSYYIMLNLPIP